MNIEFDAYKQKLNDIKPALEGLADSLNVEGLRNELERLHAMQEAPGFWDNADSLTLATNDALGSNEMNLRIDAEHYLHCFCKGFFHCKNLAYLISKLLCRHFYVYVKGIVVIYSVYHDLIVGLISLLKKNCLDLAGEYVYAADDKHIVGSAHRLSHFDKRSSTGAFLT